MDNSKIANRFKEIRAYFKLSQAAIAKKFNVTGNSWQRFESGDLPKGDTLALIAEAGVDVQWLLTGEGSMLRGAAPGAAPYPDGDAFASAILFTAEFIRKRPLGQTRDSVIRAFNSYYNDLAAEGRAVDAQAAKKKATQSIE